MSSHVSERMLTASWDSTIKLWGIGEGRGSWVAGSAAPEAEFMEHDFAVWSLDVQPEGHLAISGAEDGKRHDIHSYMIAESNLNRDVFQQAWRRFKTRVHIKHSRILWSMPSRR